MKLQTSYIFQPWTRPEILRQFPWMYIRHVIGHILSK